MVNKNFVILIGGPGLFKDCDPTHDKTWLNYVVPMQLAAQKDLYKKGADEQVHWLVFEPPYEHRWLDDSEITTYEHLEKFWFDRELHALRKQAADKVKGKGASNYLHRLKTIASNLGITYHGLRTTGDFWTKLTKFPNASISRVWYSGHAAPVGLFLSLSHDRQCGAVSTTIVGTSEIPAKQAQIAPKIDSSTKRVSEFYGCGTRDFAKAWHQAFNVPAAGAKYSITFRVIARPGRDVLTLIRTTQVKGKDPDWETFP